MLKLTLFSIILSLLLPTLVVGIGYKLYGKSFPSSVIIREDKIKPFVSWIGSKARYMSDISPLIPNNYNTFIEPFVGSGAVFMSVKPSNLIINDINSELIAAYKVIKDNPDKLISLLENYNTEHSQEFFTKLKGQDISSLDNIEIAARFIYLNKAGFAGIYKINNKGMFAGTWGHRDKINLPNPIGIQNLNYFLNSINCTIMSKDYKDILPNIGNKDFLFVDPPYDGVTTFYTPSKFSHTNHKELLSFLQEAETKGVKWLVSQHATEFILSLYSNYPMTYLYSSGKGVFAKQRTDVLIRNY